jgi:hypothetical protein
MTVDLAALAKLASGLHEEPPFWFDVDYLTTTSGGWLDVRASAYIAAASPDVVAKLVRVVLAARALDAVATWSALNRPEVADLCAALKGVE